jgi:hypothetical protein
VHHFGTPTGSRTRLGHDSQLFTQISEISTETEYLEYCACTICIFHAILLRYGYGRDLSGRASHHLLLHHRSTHGCALNIGPERNNTIEYDVLTRDNVEKGNFTSRFLRQNKPRYFGTENFKKSCCTEALRNCVPEK